MTAWKKNQEVSVPSDVFMLMSKHSVCICSNHPFYRSVPRRTRRQRKTPATVEVKSKPVRPAAGKKGKKLRVVWILIVCLMLCKLAEANICSSCSVHHPMEWIVLYVYFQVSFCALKFG